MTSISDEQMTNPNESSQNTDKKIMSTKNAVPFGVQSEQDSDQNGKA